MKNWLYSWRAARSAGELLRPGPLELRGSGGIYNAEPEWTPPPEPSVRCKVLTAFCLGKDEATGVVRDVFAGELVELEGRRARSLERRRFVEILVDRKAEAAAREAAKRERVVAAIAAAAPPPPPPPAPPRPVIPESETVMVRTLKTFCLGGGHDVAANVVVPMAIDDAIRRVGAGLVEFVEDAAGTRA